MLKEKGSKAKSEIQTAKDPDFIVEQVLTGQSLTALKYVEKSTYRNTS